MISSAREDTKKMDSEVVMFNTARIVSTKDTYFPTKMFQQYVDPFIKHPGFRTLG